MERDGGEQKREEEGRDAVAAADQLWRYTPHFEDSVQVYTAIGDKEP